MHKGVPLRRTRNIRRVKSAYEKSGGARLPSGGPVGCGRTNSAVLEPVRNAANSGRSSVGSTGKAISWSATEQSGQWGPSWWLLSLCPLLFDVPSGPPSSLGNEDSSRASASIALRVDVLTSPVGVQISVEATSRSGANAANALGTPIWHTSKTAMNAGKRARVIYLAGVCMTPAP